MSFNLLELVTDQVGPQLTYAASKYLGESEEKTATAVTTAIPAILGGLVDTGSSEKGAAGIMDFVKGMNPNMLGNVTGMLEGGTSEVNNLMNSGSGLVSTLLGSKAGGVTSLISKLSGLGSNSSSSLLKVAAPLIMSVVGKKIMGDGLGVSGLMSMLSGQKSNISAGMPSGMDSIFGSLGNVARSAMGAVTDTGKNVVSGAGDTVKGAANFAGDTVKGAANLAGDTVKGAANLAGDTVKGAANLAGDTVKGAANLAGNTVKGAANLAGDTLDTGVKTGKNMLRWLLPLFLVALLASYFGMKTGCSAIDSTVDATKGGIGVVTDGATDIAGDAANAVGDVAKGAADMTGRAMSATGDVLVGTFKNVNAAGKAALDKVTFVAGSVGNQMVVFISSGGEGDNLFRFNNLTFDTGSAKIADSSKQELDNLTAVLKAYPGIKVSIEGFTDNTGDATANVKLSTDRANAVKRYLAVNGVSQNRIGAIGLGQNNPVASNDTEEGRHENRRIEVRIVK